MAISKILWILGGGVMEFGKLGLTLALTKRQVGIGIGLGIGCVTLLGLGLSIAHHQRQGGIALDQRSVDQIAVNQKNDPKSIAVVSASQASINEQALLRSLPQWEGKLTTPTAPETIAFTTAGDRLRQVKVGRSDPFAPTESLVVQVSSDNGLENNLVPSNAQSKDSLGTSAGFTLPPLSSELLFLPQAHSPSVSTASLPPVTVDSTGLSPLPANSLPFSPSELSAPLSPTHLADQMEIKGVVELENQWQAIVREPKSTQSKTVRAGDALAGGQVKVRRIERSSNGVLQIVLEQNGIEVIRPMS